MNYTPAFEDTHDCPGQCGTAVVRNLLACRACWRRLPLRYQTPILTSRWAEDQTAHSSALVNAIAWYRLDAADNAAQSIRDMR